MWQLPRGCERVVQSCVITPLNFKAFADGHLRSVVMRWSADCSIAVAMTSASGSRIARCAARSLAAIVAISTSSAMIEMGRRSTRFRTMRIAGSPRRAGPTKHSVSADAATARRSALCRALVSAARDFWWCASPASRNPMMTPASRWISPTLVSGRRVRWRCRHPSSRLRTRRGGRVLARGPLARRRPHGRRHDRRFRVQRHATRPPGS
jgi:hypothetical protein